MKKITLFIISLSIILFSGCSTKEVFEPKVVAQDWKKYGDSNLSIVDVSSNVALLENRTLLTKDSIIKLEIGKNQRVLTNNQKWIISSKVDGNLTLSNKDDQNISIIFELKKTIATASTDKNILAVLFADDEIALYNIKNRSLLFKEQGGKSLAIDSRIVAPFFMNELVIFSTLDGKIIIVNTQLKKRLRTIIVSSKNNFNNIIYCNLIDNKIIAATNTAMLSLASKEIRAKYEIRNIIYDHKELFITTKQGEVIALNSNLDLITKTKFPFAHFLAMLEKDDKLYLLEKEGYMIVLDKKDMTKYSVHPVDIEDGYLFVGDNIFYIDDTFISIQ